MVTSMTQRDATTTTSLIFLFILHIRPRESREENDDDDDERRVISDSSPRPDCVSLSHSAVCVCVSITRIGRCCYVVCSRFPSRSRRIRHSILKLKMNIRWFSLLHVLFISSRVSIDVHCILLWFSSSASTTTTTTIERFNRVHCLFAFQGHRSLLTDGCGLSSLLRLCYNRLSNCVRWLGGWVV